MSYFAEKRPMSPKSRAVSDRLSRNWATSKKGNESDDVWNYGRFPNMFQTTSADDFKIKKVDPRVKPQRPIKWGAFGAGIDHVSFLEFEDAEVIFRRKLGLPVKDKVNEKEVEKVRLTSTHRQDFSASGFVVDESAWNEKPAGRPTGMTYTEKTHRNNSQGVAATLSLHGTV